MAGLNQRQLTKAMRAALAAGIETFEIEDPISGFVFRAKPNGHDAGSDDVKDEIARWSRGGKT